ncbi:MAG TPA: sigma factor-like helix-turn-helix DNA-binding protein [Aggregatilineales bacterium]|nr:hypothetical protein [Anaerolineales bacterium]HRE48167.1 sigma factor-like helix-turn-helix DNA-binding protein [Aggregatilineales bacterium]
MLNSTIYLNLKVMVLVWDFYASRAINSYLAWDRRTRVIAIPETVEAAFDFLKSISPIEHPNILILDIHLFADPDGLAETIQRFRGMVRDLLVLCIAHHPDSAWAAAAHQAGAMGFLVRNDLRLKLVGAVIYAVKHRRFMITESVQANTPPNEAWLQEAKLLPHEREFPEMTERIRQALWLCVVEGMPAQLAADEMGISPHTIRSYIKEGYRIMELHDDTDFPEEMSPLERAFMRFTALDDPQSDDSTRPSRPMEHHPRDQKLTKKSGKKLNDQP